LEEKGRKERAKQERGGKKRKFNEGDRLPFSQSCNRYGGENHVQKLEELAGGKKRRRKKKRKKNPRRVRNSPPLELRPKMSGDQQLATEGGEKRGGRKRNSCGAYVFFPLLPPNSDQCQGGRKKR